MENKKNPYLFWIPAILILVIVIIFSFYNHQSVDINFLFMKLSGPLFFILIIFFLLGFFLGKISHLLKRQKEKKDNYRRADYMPYVKD